MPTRSDLLTADFWIATLTRTVRGGAAAALSALGVGATDVASVPWYATLTAAGFGALASVLASLAEAKTSEAIATAYGMLGTGRHARTDSD